jgi:hypothetical protein
MSFILVIVFSKISTELPNAAPASPIFVPMLLPAVSNFLQDLLGAHQKKAWMLRSIIK